MYKKSEGENFLGSLNLSDEFKNCCPICHGSDCAQFHGYYFRQIIDEKGTYYKEFPIIRFRCQKKELQWLSMRPFLCCLPNVFLIGNMLCRLSLVSSNFN